MFCYQKNFSNPTLPVDEAQFYALVRAKQWNENIDKYRETGEASLKRKLPAFIFQATFDETTSKTGKTGAWRKQSATRLTGWIIRARCSRVGIWQRTTGLKGLVRMTFCWCISPPVEKVLKWSLRLMPASET